MSSGIVSGPLNKDLLFLSGQHRADYSFQNPDKPDETLRARRGDKDFWDHIKKVGIPTSVMKIIEKVGFKGIIECGSRKLDHALITALVERWRPETHTFHLPIGEATITLQDTNILWGLPIEGHVVSGVESSMDATHISSMFFNLMGAELPLNYIKGRFINLPFILTLIKREYPVPLPEHQSIQLARLIIYYLIGTTLFSTKATNWVHVNYFKHIEDLDACGELSWGSAVLAHLYRQLCQATDVKNIDIGGPLLLLQLWAWERFTCFAPTITDIVDTKLTYGARWRGSLSYTKTAAHVLSTYRSQLHSLSENEFIWRPYELVNHPLPDHCTSGHLSWRSDTFLICWEVVEPHLPSRVLRQFGMFQPNPTSTLIDKEKHVELHKITLKGKSSGTRNWVSKHEEYISKWMDRRRTVVTGESSFSPIASPSYMQWFMSHTVLYTVNPMHQPQNPHGFANDGGRLQMMWDGMSQIYQTSNEEPIRNMASQFMGFSHAQAHMGYRPTYMTHEYVANQLPGVPQDLRRRRRRRHGGGRGHNDNMEEDGEAGVEIRSPHLATSHSPELDYEPDMDDIGLSAPGFSQFPTQNYEEGGSSALIPCNSPIYSENFDIGASNFSSQDFSTPYSMMYHPHCDTPPAPGINLVRPTEQRPTFSGSYTFDLNDSLDGIDGVNLNDNLANRRTRRRPKPTGCGTGGCKDYRGCNNCV